MRPLGTSYSNYLEKVAYSVQEQVLEKIRDSKLITIPIEIYRSDTYGWLTEIFRLKNIPGRLQIWLDLFPNIDRPVLCLCYSNTDLNRIVKIAKAFTPNTNDQPDLTRKYLGSKHGEHRILANPLSKRFFNNPIIESYFYKFFSFYFYDKIISQSSPSQDILDKICKLLIRLLRAMASSLESEESINKVYSDIENRTRVVQHLSRERSQKLVKAAKLRDGFTCQICGFNFAENYGELGRGFAEAHHIFPLSKLNKRKRTNLDELITVCSNCHRMLHKMEGKFGDIKKLKRVIKKYKTEYNSNNLIRINKNLTNLLSTL